MHDILHRIAIASLLVCGVLTGFASVESIEASRSVVGATGTLPQLLVQHWGFMMGLLGAGLLLAAVLPSLRLPVLGAAVLSKTAFAAIALSSGATEEGGLGAALVELAMLTLLVSAGAVFLREARQDVRWHGMLPSRSEA
jgi:hypothetical protein